MQIPKISRFLSIVIVLSEEGIKWLLSRIQGGRPDEY